MQDCIPVVTNADLGYIKSVSGATLDPNAAANPCGLIAKSLFNDTFVILGPQSQLLDVSSKDIAWPSDKV